MKFVEPIREINDIKRVEYILLRQNPRNLVLFTIGTNCGLRISDILALNVDDVKDKNFIQITEKKTGKFKKFPINSKLKPMLDEYTKNKRIEEPLFTTKFKNRMSRVYAYKMISNACREAGLNDSFGTHTLRKTFGYHHYKLHKDVAILQKMFNHSSPDITLRYIGINEDILFESYSNFIL